MADITIKNIPEELYRRLKAQANANRRSLSSELLHCLDLATGPKRVTAEERLGRIRALRPRIDPKSVDAKEILAAVEKGRP